MRNSVSDAVLPQENVGSYLRQTMPNCELTYERLVADHPPLILMWMTHNMGCVRIRWR